MDERLASKRRHLESLDAGAIRAGITTVQLWLAFCTDCGISNFGIPFGSCEVDEESVRWFLRRVDADARAAVLEVLGGGQRWRRHVPPAYVGFMLTRACPSRAPRLSLSVHPRGLRKRLSRIEA